MKWLIACRNFIYREKLFEIENLGVRGETRIALVVIIGGDVGEFDVYVGIIGGDVGKIDVHAGIIDVHVVNASFWHVLYIVKSRVAIKKSLLHIKKSKEHIKKNDTFIGKSSF